MCKIRLDHFLSYVNTNDIDEYLQKYVSTGFTRISRTVKHNPGLKNGFIPFGPEYIEFLWIEDEKEFEEKATNFDREAKNDLRPVAIGIATDNIEALRDSWKNKGYEVEEIFYGRPRGADPDSEPIWGFLTTPKNVLKGTSTFFLSYLTKMRSENRIKEIPVGLNSIFGLSGLTFVSENFEERARDWKNFLAPKQDIEIGKDYSKIRIGSHFLFWVTGKRYQELYNEVWQPAKHDFGELAIIHLISDDLENTKQYFTKNNRYFTKVSSIEDPMSIFVPKVESDGFRFQITEEKVDTWMEKRNAITGEKFSIIRNSTSI